MGFRSPGRFKFRKVRNNARRFKYAKHHGKIKSGKASFLQQL